MKKPITQKINILNFIKSYARFFSCIAFFCYVTTSYSALSLDFYKNNKSDLDKIETYLNNLKNLSADFIQKSNSGSTSGKFLLSRPGKMRVEYDKNPQILIVVNGSVLSYKDLELDEVSRLRTNTTPASLLTRKNISFSAKDVEIVDFDKNSEFMSVTIIKKNRPEAGKFRLIFKNNPFGFVKMEVQDDFDQITSISLKNIKFPEKINNNLFIIRNNNLPL